jgi:hypothetical protein
VRSCSWQLHSIDDTSFRRMHTHWAQSFTVRHSVTTKGPERPRRTITTHVFRHSTAMTCPRATPNTARRRLVHHDGPLAELAGAVSSPKDVSLSRSRSHCSGCLPPPWPTTTSSRVFVESRTPPTTLPNDHVVLASVPLLETLVCTARRTTIRFAFFFHQRSSFICNTQA